MRRPVRLPVMAFALAVFLAAVTPALASEARLTVNDAAKIANAASGRAAVADGPITTFDNPAGLVRIKDGQIVVGTISSRFRADFEGSSLQIFGPRVEGDASSETKGTIPNFFLATPLSERWSLGFGINSQFGLDLQLDGITRFSTIKRTLASTNTGVAFGYAVNDKFSVGFGLDLQHITFDCNMFIREFSFTDLAPTGDIGYLTTYGSDWNWGYHFGLLYQFGPGTRLGFNYTSKIDHLLHGEGRYSSPTIPSRQSNDYNVPLESPAEATLSLYHDFNERWTLMSTVDYLFWELGTVPLRNTGAPPPFEVIEPVLNYGGTWRVALGGEFRPNETWAIMAGIYHDEGPTQDDIRNAVDFDDGRLYVGAGYRWHVSKKITFEFGYGHTFADTVPLTAPGPRGEGTGNGEFGKFDWSGDVVGLTLTVKGVSLPGL